MEAINLAGSIAALNAANINKEQPQRPQAKPAANTFKEALENQIGLQEPLFSKHAYARLAARNINLSDTQIQRVADGVLKAGEKGVKNSLVVVDGVALVVNVLNKTVITAMDGGLSRVFTNIDGAVIV